MKDKPSDDRSVLSLLAPWHWPMWLGIGLLRACALLPHPLLLKMGRALGALAYYLFPFRKDVANINLRLCFPEWDENTRQQCIRDHYLAMGMGLFELAEAWYKPSAAIKPLGEVHGLEYLRNSIDQGRGVLLLGAHFTTLEIAGRILNTHLPFACLYRKPSSPVLAREMTRMRRAHMTCIVHHDAIPELIRALREGQIVWYAPDQGKRFKYTELAPFFGEPAITNAATARIATLGRAAIHPFFAHRLSDGTYQLEISPEWKAIEGVDPVTEATRLNQLIENHVRNSPTQYFWLHKRFKARGPGLPDVYAHG